MSEKDTRLLRVTLDDKTLFYAEGPFDHPPSELIEGLNDFGELFEGEVANAPR